MSEEQLLWIVMPIVTVVVWGVVSYLDRHVWYRDYRRLCERIDQQDREREQEQS